MANKLKTIKFSNLLKNDLAEPEEHLEMVASSTNIANVQMMERLKKRGMQPIRKRLISTQEVFSPGRQQKDIKNIINQAKIHRVLLQTKFMERKESEKEKKNHKNLYMVRKRGGNSLHQPFMLNKSEMILKDRLQSETVHEENNQKQVSQTNKIKKRSTFGIEDINVCIQNSLKKKMGQARLFLSTSSNNLFSSTFYTTSKAKRSEAVRINSPTRQMRQKFMKNEMEPEIITLFPRSLAQKQQTQKRKTANKFYATNQNCSQFSRSKTEQIDLTQLCGWQDESPEEKDPLNANHFF